MSDSSPELPPDAQAHLRPGLSGSLRDQYGPMRALNALCLLEEIVSLGCSRDKRGVALFEESKRLLAAPDTTEHQLRRHLGTIFRYAEARQQRRSYSSPSVIALLERLEAFLYPDASLDPSGAYTRETPEPVEERNPVNVSV